MTTHTNAAKRFDVDGENDAIEPSMTLQDYETAMRNADWKKCQTCGDEYLSLHCVSFKRESEHATFQVCGHCATTPRAVEWIAKKFPITGSYVRVQYFDRALKLPEAFRQETDKYALVSFGDYSFTIWSASGRIRVKDSRDPDGRTDFYDAFLAWQWIGLRAHKTEQDIQKPITKKDAGAGETEWSVWQ